MNKVLLTSLLLATGLLASCDRTPAPTIPAATSGTVNGVRVVNTTTYQVGFTPLSDKAIVTNRPRLRTGAGAGHHHRRHQPRQHRQHDHH